MTVNRARRYEKNPGTAAHVRVGKSSANGEPNGLDTWDF